MTTYKSKKKSGNGQVVDLTKNYLKCGGEKKMCDEEYWVDKALELLNKLDEDDRLPEDSPAKLTRLQRDDTLQRLIQCNAVIDDCRNAAVFEETPSEPDENYYQPPNDAEEAVYDD